MCLFRNVPLPPKRMLGLRWCVWEQVWGQVWGQVGSSLWQLSGSLRVSLCLSFPWAVSPAATVAGRGLEPARLCSDLSTWSGPLSPCPVACAGGRHLSLVSCSPLIPASAAGSSWLQQRPSAALLAFHSASPFPPPPRDHTVPSCSFG